MRALQNRRVAQLVRALGRHPRGQQFESARAYQKIKELDSLVVLYLIWQVAKNSIAKNYKGGVILAILNS